MKILVDKEHKASYQEKSRKTPKKVWINRNLTHLNIDRPYQLDKPTVKPIVETNLKPEDFDSLSNIMGEEIATIVVNEIMAQQSPKLIDILQ